MTKHLAPVSPGEMLAEEFLNPIGMSKYRLAKSIGVPAQRIGDIIAGKRGISADTDLRLCRFFGLSDGWWLRLQAGDGGRAGADCAAGTGGLANANSAGFPSLEKFQCGCPRAEPETLQC
jgi:antitoxin HigA-1